MYKTGADISRKSQTALARLIKEFSYISSIESGTSTEIQYKTKFPPDFQLSPDRILSYADGCIYLNDHVLVDNIDSFQLQYCSFFDPGNGNTIEQCENGYSSMTKHIAVSLNIVENEISKTLTTSISIP
jgi:hypothetical protein